MMFLSIYRIFTTEGAQTYKKSFGGWGRGGWCDVSPAPDIGNWKFLFVELRMIMVVLFMDLQQFRHSNSIQSDWTYSRTLAVK